MKQPRTRLAAVLADKLSEGRLNAAQLAAYLLDTGRVRELNPLMRDVMQIRADRGEVEVVARSAHALGEQERQAIEAVVRQVMPKATHITISEIRDPALVGGVRLEFANERLDLSVRGKLNQLKQLTMA